MRIIRRWGIAMRSALFIMMYMLMGLFVTPAMAQKKGQLSFNFKASYADAYLFRGHMYHDDATLFGEAGIGMGKWSYQLHYADPMDDIQGSGLPTLFDAEFNHEVAYTNVAGNRIMTFGYHFFDYENGLLPDTQEIFTRVSYNRPWNPSYGITYDFDTYKGYYIDFSLTRFWRATRRSHVVFNIRAAGSYDMEEETNDDLQDVPVVVLEPGFFEKDGINHASTTVKFQWQPQKWLKIETGVDYHYAFDDLLYDDVTVERDNVVWRSSLTLTLP